MLFKLHVKVYIKEIKETEDYTAMYDWWMGIMSVVGLLPWK